MTPSTTVEARVQALMAKFEDLAVEAGKSAISIFENIDGRSPEAIALKQSYNRAFTALESAIRAEVSGKDAERVRDYLQPGDLGDLMRFEETVSDDESYDIGKPAVKRLASLGVLENHGFGRYSITAFGHFALEHMFEQKPKLPLMTNSDRDEMHRAAIQSTKEKS